MKKRIIQSLLAIACCVMVALNAIPTAEAAMRASVVTGKVTLNGQVIDNKTAKYPLLIYSNITYFWNAYSKLDSPFRTGQCCRHFLLS